MEVEQLYLGVPDDSVDLSFQDLAQLKLNQTLDTNIPASNTITPPEPKTPTLLQNEFPTLDFNRPLQLPASGNYHLQPLNDDATAFEYSHSRHHHLQNHHQDRGQRRRPGVPHSNICTLCSTYIYFFRQRCLVCGRVYCRQCVALGMGEMTEGRKCIQCLGRRFSQRYINRVGKIGIGWCLQYPSSVKQAELKWAEKGPRRNGERGDMGHAYASISTTAPSFVASSTHHHHLFF